MRRRNKKKQKTICIFGLYDIYTIHIKGKKKERHI